MNDQGRQPRGPERDDETLVLMAAGPFGPDAAATTNSLIELRAEVARRRILSAVLRAVGDVGYAALSVGRVIELARVSRATFYKHFTDKADCFAQAHRAAAEHGANRIFETMGKEPDWRSGVRAGLAELLRQAERDPALARAVLVEAKVAGGEALQACEEIAGRFAEAMDTARGEPLPHRPPLAGSFVVGGIRGIVVNRLDDESAGTLPDLLPGLLQFALIPYYGERIAAEEMAAAKEWMAAREGGLEMLEASGAASAR